MKKLFFPIIVLFSFIQLTTACAQDRSNPENVIKSYFSETKKQNLSGLISFFAIDKYINNFNFKHYSQELGIITPTSQLLPEQYSIYQELNKYFRSSQVTNQVRVYLLTIISNNDDIHLPITVNNGSTIDSFIQNINPQILSSLKLLYIRNPTKKLDPVGINEIFIKQARRIGAEDSSERVALIQIENTTFMVPFRFIKYNNEWYIESLISNFAGEFTGEMSESTFLSKFPE
ncbi:MAG: hypothetical protein EHM20_08975 [Alphaproteobacteria bacterium]|nr:MAG: hypothetical protein EHM20_08975 [Alphaproteobacteria bacterium]